MRLSGVALRYGRSAPWVLKDVELALEPGDVVEVTGRNGAGKSSLLRIAVGALAPTRGGVTGRPSVVGWAPERFDVGLPLTTGAYLRACAGMRGLTVRAAAEALERETHRWNAEPLLGTRLTALSKGSAQKVGLMQALLVPPQLLVLDEPWSGLDAAARAALPAVVISVAAAGGRVLVTDHQQQASALPLTACWNAASGSVVATAPPATLPATPAIVRVRLPALHAAALVARLGREGFDAELEP